jgi:phosphopantothenoylcysteine decarboxylase/phosphopantothenate--cysteine ligase
VSLAPPAGVTVTAVNTAREMLAACEAALPADVLVMAAAVADWRPDTAANSMIKKSAADSPESRATPQLKLVENPDILATLAAHPRRPRLVVGFAAETDNVVANATAKRGRKGADWIIANDVSGNVMGGERNRVHLVSATGVEDWPEMTKTDVATHLAARIAAQLKGDTDAP